MWLDRDYNVCLSREYRWPYEPGDVVCFCVGVNHKYNRWSHGYSPISQGFSPAGEQLEHRKLAHELWQPTAGCIAIFHKYCCYSKRDYITTNLALRNHWGYAADVSKYHNAGKLSMD